MTLNVGDKVVMIPLRNGEYAAVQSGDINVGDKVVMIPGRNGEQYVVKVASPQIGDKVVMYPLRNGDFVCLASADGGGSGPAVPTMISFDVQRMGPDTAGLHWNRGSCTGVRVVRRTDRYPTTITDGVVAYDGSSAYADDTGLDFRLPYYYSAWGKLEAHFSNEYLTDRISMWNTGTVTICVCGAWIGSKSWTIQAWWDEVLVLDQLVPRATRQDSCLVPGVQFRGIPCYGESDIECIQRCLTVSASCSSTYSAGGIHCRINELGGRRYDVGFEDLPIGGDQQWDDPALIVEFR